MTTTTDGVPRSVGVKMRVHGVGDHGDFSALGRPVFRIGRGPGPHRKPACDTKPRVEAHQLESAHMAGFMGPNRTDRVL
jgi:hypothetical protein